MLVRHQCLLVHRRPLPIRHFQKYHRVAHSHATCWSSDQCVHNETDSELNAFVKTAVQMLDCTRGRNRYR